MIDRLSNKEYCKALGGTTKGAIHYSNIVVFYVFDKNPAYFLSTTIKNIT